MTDLKRFGNCKKTNLRLTIQKHSVNDETLLLNKSQLNEQIKISNFFFNANFYLIKCLLDDFKTNHLRNFCVSVIQIFSMSQHGATCLRDLSGDYGCV